MAATDQTFRSGDDIALDMLRDCLKNRQKGQIIVTDGVKWILLDDLKKEKKRMDPSQEKPLYGQAEVIDHRGKSTGVPAAKKPPVNIGAMLQNMPYGARMAWWRRNRPSLEKLATQPAGLSASQQKAFDKRARKRATNLGRVGKQ